MPTTRRQAVNVCDPCRQRKTKCDEAKPSCSRCSRLKIECSYVDAPLSVKTLKFNQLSETLGEMNGKLDQIHQLISHGISAQQPQHGHGPTAPSISIRDCIAEEVDFGSAAYQSSPVLHMSTISDTNSRYEELSLSQKHLIAPQHLLAWNCSPITLNPFEQQYPMRLEISRSMLPGSTIGPRCLGTAAATDCWLSNFSMTQFILLSQFYFNHFHPTGSILDEATYFDELEQVVENGFAHDTTSCLVLLVCALGSIVVYHTGHTEWSQSDNDEDGVDDCTGLGFFNLALGILHDVQTTDWRSVQCSLLISLFYNTKLRVYEAWRSNHQACCTIMILLPLEENLESYQCQLFWVAYLQESQILAEFDFPSSGLGNLSGSVPLPVVLATNTNPQQRQYQFFFLSLITIRKLLNRTIYHIYHRDVSREIADHEGGSFINRKPGFLTAPPSLFEELNRQLEEWRVGLPQGLRFSPYSTTHDLCRIENHPPMSTQERLRMQLLCRYHVAKSIIYRPYIYRALHNDLAIKMLEDAKRLAYVALDSATIAAVRTGLLEQPLALLYHPVNVLINVFATDILIQFVLKAGGDCHFALPLNWEAVAYLREHISSLIERISPTAARDFEIIKQIERLEPRI